MLPRKALHNYLPLVFSLLFTLFSLHTTCLPADVDAPALQARQTPPIRTFSLRVGRGKDPREPRLNSYLEIDRANGDVFVNQTRDSTLGGLRFALNPGSSPDPTVGRIFQRGSGWRGYLEPLIGIDFPRGRYQFKFKHFVPNFPEILHKNFTLVGRGCGGNCGGLALGYNSAVMPGEGFYVVPHPDKIGIWLLQWYQDADAFTTIPANGIPVYVWVESLAS